MKRSSKSGKLVVSHIIGGLGNQMFQYATGRALASSLSSQLKLDVSDFANGYNLHEFSLTKYKIDYEPTGFPYRRKWMKLLGFLMGITHFKEASFAYSESIFSLQAPLYLEGYWQSAKYFHSIREELLEEFVPKGDLSDFSIKIFDQIENSNSVSIHVRRGDYVTDPNANKVHGVCTFDYYDRAVKTLMSKLDSLENVKFFVFSDDQEWVKENMNIPGEVIFVDGNGPERNHEDIYLMSQCKHNIIANSSFSWWGAWLNSNPDRIVIAPKQWFADPDRSAQDLVEEKWLTV